MWRPASHRVGCWWAAVEGLDKRLAVLVDPEADAGRLALHDGPGGGRPLAEVVVQGVDALVQTQIELVVRDGAARSADSVDPLGVAGGLSLDDRVATGRRLRKTWAPSSSVNSAMLTGLPKYLQA